jgi:hypothetical protein
LELRDGVEPEREVSGGRIVETSPSNEVPGDTIPMHQQQLHAWEDGVSWVIETLPYGHAVKQLEYQVPRVEQHQGSAAAAIVGTDVVVRRPESVAF